VLADIFEIKVPIKPSDEGRERDQELGEWRVHVHEECLLDILSRESSEMYFVKPTKVPQRSATIKKTKGQRTYTTLDGCQIFQHLTTTAKTVNPTIHLTSPFPISISRPYQCSFLCNPFPVERLCPDESDDGPYTCCLSLASASESGRALARGAREGSMVGFLRVMDASGA
jgi:hypothetical protein